MHVPKSEHRKAKLQVWLFALAVAVQGLVPNMASAQYAITPAGIQKGTGADVYGSGFRYHLEAPTGWPIDTQSGKADGLGAVFYPDGGSWSNSPVVMYTRIVEHSGKTLAQVIDGDLKDMANDSRDFRATDRPTVVSANRQTALIKDLTGERSGQVERVAYFEEKQWVVLIVLVAHSEADLKKSFQPFQQLTKSYRYIK